MGGTPIGLYELPKRAEVIRATLEDDARFTFVDPTRHGTEPVEAVHDPGLVEHLASAWQRVAAQVEGTAEVMPDTFLHPALREGMGPAPLPADAVAGAIANASAVARIAPTATLRARRAIESQPLRPARPPCAGRLRARYSTESGEGSRNPRDRLRYRGNRARGCSWTRSRALRGSARVVRRVVVVDDQESVRALVRAALAALVDDDRYEVVGETGDRTAVVDLVASLQSWEEVFSVSSIPIVLRAADLNLKRDAVTFECRM